MKKTQLWSLVALMLTGGVAARRLISQSPPVRRVGPLADGGFLLNSGWIINAAGEQVPVDTLPMSTALSRDGKFLLVLNAGYNPPSISVIDIAQKKEVRRTKLADAFLGLAVSPREDKVYVGGGASSKVFELALNPDTGELAATREFTAVKDPGAKGNAFIGDVVITHDAHLLYATDLHDDQVAVVNLQSGLLIDTFKTGKRPYRLLLPPGGKTLLVSAWGEGSVYQHEATSGELIRKIRVGPHPTDMVWLNRAVADEDGKAGTYIARLFVTAGNSNNAYSFGASDDGQLTALETISLSLTPTQPLGMTPSALALDAKGQRLYAVCSDGNTVAQIDITGPRSRVLGFIPAGWYPTAVRVLNDDQLVIVNGKGRGSKPNPAGLLQTQTGSVGFLPTPDPAQILEMTSTVRANSPYLDELIEGPPNSEQAAFFQRTPDHPSPIEHVIYVIKESGGYDQVLGDLPKGNGNASFTVFGEKYTPNLHQLAKDYILYDNFYVNGDIGAEGHNWVSAAIAPEYTVKLWPSEYGNRSQVHEFEGGESANLPPAGYLWSNALQAGATVRDYGEWTANFPMKQVVSGVQIKKVNDHSLFPYVNKQYRGPDLDYPDVDRAREFTREWKEFDANGNAPGLAIVRMGNDQTKGTAAGALTPLSFIADNDYALGLLVDAVSHSRLWESTAIFIVEADTGSGPDHVDSHRAPLWVISPYTRRAIVDSGMYNQTGVLRSMELILGLRPMTQFDAAARPLFESFSRTPDTSPFTTISPKVPLTDHNAGQASRATESARPDF